MDEQETHTYKFSEIMANIRVDFVEKITVAQFIKLIEQKHNELKKDKGFNIFPGFAKVFSEYSVDLKNHLNNTLYEFKFSCEDRTWMLGN